MDRSTKPVTDLAYEPEVIGVNTKPLTLEVHLDSAVRSGTGKWFGVGLRLVRDQKRHEDVHAAYIIAGHAVPMPAWAWVRDEMQHRVTRSPWGMVFYARNKTEVKDWLLERGFTVNWQGYPVSIDFDKREERGMRLTDDNLVGKLSDVRTPSDRASVIRARIARLEAEAARLDALPAEPDTNPAIIYFEKQFPGTSGTYTYGAVKASDSLWYTTGPKSPKGYTWERLVGFIYEGKDPDDVEVWYTSELKRL